MSLADFRKSFYQLSCFPIGNVRYGVRDRFIIWEGEVQPLWYTGKYTLCLNYERLWPPRIWVVNPDLSKYKLPHVYPGNYLCLYHPTDWSWQSSYNIVDTIIRWSQMWIVYFEDFLRTRVWRGPEADHDMPQKDDTEKKGGVKKKKKRANEESPVYLKSYPTRLPITQKAKKKKAKKRR